MGYLDDLRNEGLLISSRTEWGSDFLYGTQRPLIELPAPYLYLHISVTHLSADWRADMRTIEDIGAKRFPNTGISYSAAAFPDGRLADGQPLWRKGAHTVNDLGTPGYPYDLNGYGHAICLPQMVDDPVTDAQVDAIARWGAALVRAGYSTAREFLPHRMFANKDCPGDRAIARLAEINSRLRHYSIEGLFAMELSDKVNLKGEAAGAVLGMDSITVDGALGNAAAAFRTARTVEDKVDALGDRLDRLTGTVHLDDTDRDLIAAAIAGKVTDDLADAVADKLAARLQA